MKVFLAISISVGLLVACRFRMNYKMKQASEWSSIHSITCTFEHLYESFPPRKSTADNAEDCWKLSDEIVRVPVSAIKNYNKPLIPVGSGTLGGIHKAEIQLSDGTSCIAAVKTDQCRESWWSWQQTSCLSETARLWLPRSYMGAEYTAALVWYAQRKLGRTVPGLLPTWGLIEDNDHPLYNDNTNRQGAGKIEGYPHPDPAIKGVIMPLSAFAPVSNLLENDSALRVTTTTSQIAKIMLPAAQGLEFVGSMGLAFRDLIEKNVGILAATGEAIVYDNSLMGLKRVEDCRSLACNFCMENDVFPSFDDHYHRVTKGIRAGHPYILGDMHNFRNVIIKIIKNKCRSSEQATKMVHDVIHTTDVRHLIQVLTQYATTSATAAIAVLDGAVATAMA